MDIFFDEEGKIRDYDIANGELVLKNDNGYIPVPKDEKTFYEENHFSIMIDKEQLKLAIHDDLNTRILKTCKKCKNKVAVIFRYKQQTLYICDQCGNYD